MQIRHFAAARDVVALLYRLSRSQLELTVRLIHLALTVLTCGFMKIVAIVEGIIYLTKTDAEFVQTYQIGTKEWF